jgi:hypothetical protein
MKISTFSPVVMPVSLPERKDIEVNENTRLKPALPTLSQAGDAHEDAGRPHILQRRMARQMRRAVR